MKVEAKFTHTEERAFCDRCRAEGVMVADAVLFAALIMLNADAEVWADAKRQAKKREEETRKKPSAKIQRAIAANVARGNQRAYIPPASYAKYGPRDSVARKLYAQRMAAEAAG